MKQMFPCSHLLLTAFKKKKSSKVFLSLDLIHGSGFIASSSLWSLFFIYEATLALNISIVAERYLPTQRFWILWRD